MIACRSALLALVSLLTIPAAQAARPTTRLEHCGAATCLLVRGYRQDATAPVLIAGHPIAVEGARAWRVALPLDNVRRWSTAWARALPVQVGGPEAEEVLARLPIGLLGHREDLAFLDVHVPR